MSTKPPQGLDAAFEDDPTGVRELLRGLPDPGPMPADVSDRIRDALARESADRAPGRLYPLPIDPARGAGDGVDAGVDAGVDDDPTGIRDLLRSQPDPGPMPNYVAAQVLDSLRAEFGANQSSFDDDPTGIRDLLRSQPAPGPMPDHVSKRIMHRLDLEREAAADADPTGTRDFLRSQPDPGPMPDDVAARVTAALRHESERRGEQPSNVTALHSRDRSATPARSGKLLRFVGGAAAAAVAGVIALGAFQSLGSHDAPPTQAVTSTAQAPSGIADKVYVTSTDKNYTRASLSTDAGSLARADLATGLAPADANKLGSVATKDGALTCAAAIGQEVLDRSSRITVDIAQYEGRPALVVVATGDASSTVWVLNRDCDKSQTPIAGPATVS